MGRLSVIGSLAVLGILFLESKLVSVVYASVGVAAVVSGLLVTLYLRNCPAKRWPLRMQFLLDAFLLGLLIHYGGGIDGPLVVFFYLHSAAAGLYLGMLGGGGIALLDSLVILASGLYSIAGTGEPTGSVTLEVLGRTGLISLSFRYVLLKALLDFLILAAVGLVSGYLSELLERESGRVQSILHALREVRTRSREILESMEDGVLVIDDRGNPISVNAAARRILSLGRDWQADVRETELYRMLSDYLSTGEFPENIDLVMGENIVECRMANFLNESGEPAGAMAVMTDVTEVRTLRSQLDEQEKLAVVGRLSSTMAHEIRNPLASMSGAAQILMQGGTDDQGTARMTRLIVNQARRISEVIEGYLQISRSSGPPSMAKLNLADVVREAVESSSHGIARGVEFEVDVPDEVEVVGSRPRLSQMLNNLIRNSAEATESMDERLISVRLQALEGTGTAELVVEDNGPGFPDDIMDSATRPFVTTKEEGTGLGLYVARKVVQDHKGRMILQRSDTGSARVRVILPLAATSEIAEEGTDAG
ncbi:PAS domain-containing protein [Candidatus Fermentibacteria bacterium]|nr:PAS domain-containing protein [Candidatus Fermentibacteria bacterium]